ncbi:MULTISPECIES: hypothetical protein [unclassified Halorhabdus]|uniref:hypothetical protein n=1 Tax=unclassified Halorhabdus TaxID=2621901 RepID=UPI0012B381EA|nr:MULTISPECIES: hypothetical protein [unclassified Halorhabdus]
MTDTLTASPVVTVADDGDARDTATGLERAAFEHVTAVYVVEKAVNARGSSR